MYVTKKLDLANRSLQDGRHCCIVSRQFMADFASNSQEPTKLKSAWGNHIYGLQWRNSAWPKIWESVWEKITAGLSTDLLPKIGNDD